MKLVVPPGQFERTLKRFFRKVRHEGIAAEVAEREAYRSRGETKRISRRKAIKRQIKADAERAALDAASAAPATTLIEHQQLLLTKMKSSSPTRGKT